ncbi:hypothetical protein F52700_2579 [Fusarium sp. NRRL 52700]|nr:hypothetical protein F52700_2579 [Fusarium sp. NRRL 52700]
MDQSTAPPFPYAILVREDPVILLEEKFNNTVSRTHRKIKFEVLETYLNTKSHMMRVSFKNSQGNAQIGVLKLFDRRYAGRIRQINGQAKAPSFAADDAYLNFVRQGKITRASHFLHSQSYGGSQADRVARFEAATWYENDERFKTELRAYKQLESLQGSIIPRLFAHVRIPHASIDPSAPDDAKKWDEFLCVHGLLLEYIAGPKLNNWPTSYTSAEALNTISQHAVSAMDRINELGILLEKHSNDVIVKDGLRVPLILDFAEATFKKDLDKIEIKKLDTSKLLATEVLVHRMDIAY